MVKLANPSYPVNSRRRPAGKTPLDGLANLAQNAEASATFSPGMNYTKRRIAINCILLTDRNES